MHQTPRGLGFSITAAWRGLNGYSIMKKYILQLNFWGKVPLTSGNKSSLKVFYIRLPWQGVRWRNEANHGCTVWRKMSTHCYGNMLHFLCSIYWKDAFHLWKNGLFKKLFTYGCHDTARGQWEGNTLWYALCGETMSRYHYGNVLQIWHLHRDVIFAVLYWTNLNLVKYQWKQQFADPIDNQMTEF